MSNTQTRVGVRAYRLLGGGGSKVLPSVYHRYET